MYKYIMYKYTCDFSRNFKLTPLTNHRILFSAMT